jgi:hypothetical protein
MLLRSRRGVKRKPTGELERVVGKPFQDRVSKLPTELLLMILNFVEVTTLLDCCWTVSKRWQSLCSHPRLWKTRDCVWFEREKDPFAKIMSRNIPLKSVTLDYGLMYASELLQRCSGIPITTLNVGGCIITDKGCLSLLSPTIENLTLRDWHDLPDSELIHLSKLPLRALSLVNCMRITDTGLSHLSDIPLNKLCLDNCFNLTNAGLSHLSGMPLHTLSLQYVTNVTGVGLSHLSELPLRSLNLRGCIQITDDDLRHLGGLPLNTLVLDVLRGITAEGLSHLSELPLHTLSLQGCSRVTCSCLDQLIRMPLRTLYLYDCSILCGLTKHHASFDRDVCIVEDAMVI